MITDGRANRNSLIYPREVGATVAFLFPIYLFVVSAPLALVLPDYLVAKSFGKFKMYDAAAKKLTPATG
jgi:hypothetical protein